MTILALERKYTGISIQLFQTACSWFSPSNK